MEINFGNVAEKALEGELAVFQKCMCPSRPSKLLPSWETLPACAFENRSINLVGAAVTHITRALQEDWQAGKPSMTLMH